MSIHEGLIALGVPLLLGAGILRAAGIGPRDGVFCWLGRLFPVGATALALVLFAFMAGGLSVRSPAPGLVAGLAGGALLFLPRRRTIERYPVEERTHPLARLVAAVLAAFCFVAVAFVCAGDVNRPVHRDDDALIWGMKARYLVHHETFDDALGETLADPTRGGHHLDYPLLNPLLQVWVTTLAGEYDDVAVRYPTMAWLVSFVLLLLGATRRRCGAVTGSLLTLGLVGVGVVWVVGTGAKSDLITALALLGCLDSAARWMDEDGARRHVASCALFAAVLVWSKNEGMMLALAALLAALMTRPRAVVRGLARPSAPWFVVPVAVVLMQWWFNTRYGLVNDLLAGGEGTGGRSLLAVLIENFPRRCGTIARAFAGNMAWVIADDGSIVHRFGYHDGLYLAFLALIALCPRRALAGSTRMVTLTALGGLAAYFLVYVVSYQDLDWHLYTSLPRVQSHLLPAMVLGIALMLRGLRRDARRRISREPART